MSFLRLGAVYTAANLASAAVPFALLPLLTRVLSPEQFASIVAFAMLVTLSQSVAGLNAHAAMGVVWFKRPAHEVPAFTATALAVAGTSTLAVAAAVWLLLRALPGLSSLDAGWGVLAVVTAGANVVLQCRLVLWQSRQQAWPSALLQVATSVLNVGLSLLLVLVFGMGADGRNGAIATAAVLAALAAVLAFRHAGELRWAPTAEQRRTLLQFGLPLILHSAAGVLIGTADRWAVALQLDARSLGIYGAGAQLGMVMAMLADAFVKAYSPWLYARLRSDTASERLVAVGAIYVAMPAFLALAVVVGLVLHGLSAWLLGSRFQAAAGVLPWFMLGGAASGIYMCTSVLFFFHGRTGMLALVTGSAAACGALLTWQLVSQFGLPGAAAGYAATQGLLALLCTVAAMRMFPLPWASVLPSLGAWRQGALARQGALST